MQRNTPLSPMVARQIKKRLANGDSAHHLRQVYGVSKRDIERLRLDLYLERQGRKVG